MEAYFVRQNRKLPAYAKGLLLLMLLLKPFPGWAQALPTVVVQPHPVDLTLPVAATVEAIAMETGNSSSAVCPAAGSPTICSTPCARATR